ncbi:MAG TPA: endonuclease/exonuclease/phosphatase [Paracoccaceae bacterium]|nr:endonuclease/exonuclease/phosphatase [Paracoccaceae bacterium]HMO72123.1 endonuclease/exonuclease/phosphatase [Paracoccaceae bacterium]
MDHFKLVAWNIEDSNQLIGPDLAPKPSAAARLDAIAEEIAEMAPDILLVGEGPRGEARAQALFDRVAPDHALVIRDDPSGAAYGTKGNQWLWFLVRKAAPVTGRLLHLDRWRALTDPGWGDQRRGAKWNVSYPIFNAAATNLHFHVPGTHEHYRHPQVLLAEIALPGGGIAHLEVIGCHLKSKINKVHPKGDAYADDFFDTQPALVADIMTSRIKLTTEATDLRHYIEGRFRAEPDAAIVVAGDLNDGPGKERIERRFLYHDLVSNLQGDVFLARQFLNHALFDFEDAARWSYDLGRDRLDPARNPRILLDHIMFTQALTGPDRPDASAFRARAGGGKVEHDVHHRVAARRARSAATSDHRAVSMVFDRRAGLA